MTDQITTFDAHIDFLVGELLARRRIPENTDRLKELGAAAVPRLLHHLESTDRARKTIAFYGLQSCWSARAIAAVQPYLAESDPELRRMAAIVLVKGSGYQPLIEGCLPLLTDPRPDVCAFALEHVESESPDLNRARHLLARPATGSVLVPHLPRYHAAELIPDLLRLLDRGEADQLPFVLAALIHTNGDSAPVRGRVTALLDAADPEIRAMAAEYLTWHGTEADSPALNAALARESDPFAAAAHKTAIGLLAGRPPRLLALEPGRPVPAGERRAAFAHAVRALDTGTAETNADALAAAWSLYRHAESFEPHIAHRGTEPDPALAVERQARLALQARLFSIPGAVVPGTVRQGNGALPLADRFSAPHRGFDPRSRSNFGHLVKETADEAFPGLVHVGADSSWHRPHAGIHAIAAGIVCSIACSATWGVVVVIEHQEQSGRKFCSIYAHLSPFVTVRVGDIVEAGQKIGAVGRACTWENGGYAAHLHFGLHDGGWRQKPHPGRVTDVRYRGEPYRGLVLRADDETIILRIATRHGREQVHKPNTWLVGYVSEQWFEAGDHGWLEPHGFLARRGVITDMPQPCGKSECFPSSAYRA
ncbi:MAG: peptidoglycan DD-metalloendopeptidase family protein [Rhodospirillaceae bacterium]